MDMLRRLDVGSILIGLIVVGVGIYYTLVNVFGFQLAELNWDMVWPLAVVAVGVGILWEAWRRTTPHGGSPTGS